MKYSEAPHPFTGMASSITGFDLERNPYLKAAGRSASSQILTDGSFSGARVKSFLLAFSDMKKTASKRKMYAIAVIVKMKMKSVKEGNYTLSLPTIIYIYIITYGSIS